MGAASKFQMLNKINYNQHTNLTSESLLSRETLPGPFLVDNMKDEACNSYGALPERLYVILDGKIVYQVHYFICLVKSYSTSIVVGRTWTH